MLLLAVASYRVKDKTYSSFEDRTTLATPSANVSAFVRAIIGRLLPPGTWGTGEAGAKNQRSFFRSIDQLVRRGKYESLSLHEALQGLTVSLVVFVSFVKLINVKGSACPMAMC